MSEVPQWAHFEFWRKKSVPSSWTKFRDIALYWIAQGVDGFRYDMAEMVPVEFWSFLNSSIKQQNPDVLVLQENYIKDRNSFLFPYKYNNYRKVKSIYFDNNLLELYKDSIEGSNPRKKIRIRNYPEHKNNYLLEKKISSIEGRYKTSKKISDKL